MLSARKPSSSAPDAAGLLVNDVHSALNPTRVAAIERIRSLDDILTAVRSASDTGSVLSIAGGRHAMGGQQFASGARLLDTRGFDRVLSLDRDAGVVRVEAGIQWPQLIGALQALQAGEQSPWGIVQKQTGADRLSIGGAAAANVHGRGLRLRPFVQDIESFELVTPDSEMVRCARDENADLFALAVGGYGLFGIIATVSLRLQRRHTLERVVTLTDSRDLMARFDARIAAGFTYGDFQFAIDPEHDDFLSRGVLSCYRPIGGPLSIHSQRHALSAEDWQQLLLLAHTDKTAAFQRYADHYLATSGQCYCSDRHQLSVYLDDYHAALDARLGRCAPGSEAIGELYVPRARFEPFIQQLRETLRERRADVIYGTVRLIERDDETVLAWAREDYACVVLNLHVDHTPAGVARVAADFRSMYDIAVTHGGSFFLTYHRFARRDQLIAAHPRLPEFLLAKRVRDPSLRFQSEWYRHLRDLIEGNASRRLDRSTRHAT